MPACTCLPTTSATALRMRAASADGSTGTPSSRANIVRMRSSGRGKLPVWVVRMRSVLRFIADLLASLVACSTRRCYHAGHPDDLTADEGGDMNLPRPLALGCVFLLCLLLAGGVADEASAQSKPEGEMRWALYVTLSPVWFDPGEFQGLTPFWVLYAIHDALVKPMPGNLMTPSLAESWTASADQLVYEFKLREGLKFHNGDPFTAEDVKFSFHRAKGSKILHDKVRAALIC